MKYQLTPTVLGDVNPASIRINTSFLLFTVNENIYTSSVAKLNLTLLDRFGSGVSTLLKIYFVNDSLTEECSNARLDPAVISDQTYFLEDTELQIHYELLKPAKGILLGTDCWSRVD